MCLRSRTRGSHYIKFACAEIIRKCIIERKKGERKYVRRIKELIIRYYLREVYRVGMSREETWKRI